MLYVVFETEFFSLRIMQMYFVLRSFKLVENFRPIKPSIKLFYSKPPIHYIT